jgi:hypothetical protein
MVRLAFIILLLTIFEPTCIGSEFFHKFHKRYSIKNNTNDSRTVSVGLVLVSIPQYRNIKHNTFYNETLSYSKDNPFGDEHGRSTNVHETVHGINNQLRNEYKVQLKKDVNGFYAGNGRGIIILLVQNAQLMILIIIFLFLNRTMFLVH